MTVKYGEAAPTVTEVDQFGSKELHYQHPAYGQMTVSRQQGGNFNLYGSEFSHNHTISIQLTQSEMHRHLSRDWHHSGKLIAEVRLSEAQWATFVSSFNQGNGVPVTVEFSEGDGFRPRITPRPMEPLFVTDADTALKEALEALNKLAAQVTEASVGLSAKKAAVLKEQVLTAQRRLYDSIPFISKSFAEHMETTVEKAKIEVNAYVTSAVMRAGLEALNAEAPLQLAGPTASE